MHDTQFTDPTRDLGNRREVQLDNGNKYLVTRDPLQPFGFWRIHMEKGQVPVELSGLYTTFSAAEDDIRKYVLTTRRKVTAVKEK